MSQDMKQDQEQGEDVCPICLDAWTDNMATTECGHRFHTKCLLANVLTNRAAGQSCPLCRVSLCEATTPASLPVPLAVADDDTVEVDEETGIIRARLYVEPIVHNPYPCVRTLSDGRLFTIDSEGNRRWRQHGRLHRDEVDDDGNVLPALIMSNGREEWWQHGRPHRDHDLPAIVSENGDQFWYTHGLNNRQTLDAEGRVLPAVIKSDTTEWWVDGNLHRDHDLPAIVKPNGDQYWYQHGERHRDTRSDDEHQLLLPALIEYNGTNSQCWKHGQFLAKESHQYADARHLAFMTDLSNRKRPCIR